ncbi:MAG: bi-domain-containing oxidoreductase [Gaiellaceae bacterium]
MPQPELSDGGVLVDVRASLLSAGTERTKVETARMSLLGKARSRPDQVRRVVEKARRDGLAETVRTVRARLDQPSALGYSAAGVVLGVGPLVSDLAPGDRVAIGGDHAVHADVDHVPMNLCVRIPDALRFDEAAFATVGAIALHGVRQAAPTLGERVAVIGLGLVGQLAAQILRAAGCTVVGVDLSPGLVEHALRTGAVDVGYTRSALSPDRLPADAADCDAVVVTAATRSNDPVSLAAHLCRDRGRVVVVGLVGMELPRAAYYAKELELRLSRSYGPGRYDVEYEERGLDYPVGYVRWTERRNMAAFLALVAAGKVDVAGLVTERVPIEDAAAAYERLVSSAESPLGIVLEYGPAPLPVPSAPARSRTVAGRSATVGVVGPGSFARRLLIPALRDAGFRLAAVASGSGLSARSAADAHGFERAATVEEVLADPTLGAIVVATRHASHARIAAAALRAGKGAFVEKPPCLTWAELADLRTARTETGSPLAVGFNRRHAPLAVRLREHVRAANGPIELVYRVNAGRLEPGHWLNDLEEGGGRLLGEGCHFVDFACWLAAAAPRRVTCLMAPAPGHPLAAAESFTVALEFGDGSIATILYSSGGSARLGKERAEAHAGGRSAILDDFRTLRLLGPEGSDEVKDGAGDKGHRAQLEAFRRELDGGPAAEPDPLDSMAATLAALESAQLGVAVDPAEGDGG